MGSAPTSGTLSLCALTAAPQQSTSELGSAFGLHVNSRCKIGSKRCGAKKVCKRFTHFFGVRRTMANFAVLNDLQAGVRQTKNNAE